ncbi:MAG: peptidase U32 family protein [Bacilli bacterium]
MTKLLLIPKTINSNIDIVNGVIIGLKDYSVGYDFCLDVEQLKEYVNKNSDKDIFVAINKNLTNSDLIVIENVLKKLSVISIKGVLFYDISILYLKQKLNISIDLVWNQTHMVTNYNTCNYYYEEGCKYAYLSNEITLDEMLEICDKSKIKTLAMVFGHSTIAHSKRKLLSNYFYYINKNKEKNRYDITETINNNKYIVEETNLGTTIFNKKLLNGIRPLFELNNKLEYAIIEEDDNTNFEELVSYFRKVVDNEIVDKEMIIKRVDELYPNTTEGFFYKKTIYKVKKDE